VPAVIDDGHAIAIEEADRIGNLLRRDHVPEPHLHRLQIQRARNEVDQTLDHEHRFGSTSATIGRIRSFVGGNNCDRGLIVRHVIWAKQMHCRVDRCAYADRHIGARILQQPIAYGKDAAVGIERDLGIVTVVTGMRGIRNVLATVLDPLHGPPQSARDVGDEHVFRINMALDAEPAADFRGDAAHTRLGLAEAQRYFAAHPMHDLRRRPHHHRVAARIMAGDDPAAFNGHCRVAMIVEAVADRPRA
jgi:hypothetical protein